MDLTISSGAEKFIKRMVNFSGLSAGAGFRLSVKPGGCSGLASEFSVESEPLPGDATVTIQGIKLFLPAESRLLLQGVTMDFVETPMSSGFVFQDPKSAGCGTCSTSAPAGAGSEVKVVSFQPKAN
jgi:iron-sulfur cluster assembly protein